jgi:tRNA (cmo5U34)-methyltransferase
MNVMNKSTVDEIRRRFDGDVERFSNLDTGQVSTVDAPLSLELITEAAKRVNPGARTLLDVGCGAGNYTVKMLDKIPDLDCVLLDLSLNMLNRACERVKPLTAGAVNVMQSDIRTAPLGENRFDIILAGAVLHHLRDDVDWKRAFAKLYISLKPGGCLMISDLVAQDTPVLTEYIWEHYKNYLNETGGPEYCSKVLDYIEKEDSPRSVTCQMELMRTVGFTGVDILHKHICFAAFCGIKPSNACPQV